MTTTVLPLNLEHRRALLWVRAHQPADMGNFRAGAPTTKTRIALLNAGLIEFNPERKRFDPVTYCLTVAGEKALKP